MSAAWARACRTPSRGVLRDLASIYADHPDYREEWRPWPGDHLYRVYERRQTRLQVEQ